MPDNLHPLPLDKLLKIIIHELDHKDSYFGIPSPLFFDPGKTHPHGNPEWLKTTLFGKRLDTPIGIAAGPHSQMAQGIVAAWLSGARYIELKTVQTLDELDIPRPCIDMQDEGYNCEWSQELKITQSFEEYLNAWIIIHVLNHRFGWDGTPGVVFNMSVGYDLKGIRNENMQWFLEQMGDCTGMLNRKKKQIRAVYPAIDDVPIPARISDNVTLSTMHGCPANEISSIAAFLMQEKGLHTYIKLNPTLLGPERLRDILNGRLGFPTEVGDEAFAHDLQYPDALHMIRQALSLSAGSGPEFGLKLTNTLETVNNRDVFGDEVKSTYMSGRALHPLSVELARQLQGDFDGRLALSFSGGADAFNAASLLACGFKTITSCTDLLKPGGVMRLHQYLENIMAAMQERSAASPGELICRHAQCNKTHKEGVPEAVRKHIRHNLNHYAREVLDNRAYHKDKLSTPDIRTGRVLGVFDCISAPCREHCAAGQDIPGYMLHTAHKEYSEAHRTILRTNPFPAVTGMICDQQCQRKCTRVHYDDPLLIRDVKRINAAFPAPKLVPADPNGKRVAVIGAGPSGLSCAFFLTLYGFSVDVYERASRAGGMVTYAIPGFRLTDDAMEKDLERIRALGVRIHYNTNVGKTLFERLKKTYDHVYVATGAPVSKPLSVEGIDAEGVLDPIGFLMRTKGSDTVRCGQQVVVIGGGNTAMDAARTAFRLTGENGSVVIIYRRTIAEMPADQGEIKAVLDEGIRIIPLTGPVKVYSRSGSVHALQCIRMTLAEKDGSGRPRPVPVKGSEFIIPCDTIIPAVGQVTETGFMDPEDLVCGKGSYHTRVNNVYAGGDALRGASTAINAIGDGRKAAIEIAGADKLPVDQDHSGRRGAPDHRGIIIQRAKRRPAPVAMEVPVKDRKNFNLVQLPPNAADMAAEAERCLQCDQLCNTCVGVCPNLAMQSFNTEPVVLQLEKAVRKAGGAISITSDVTFSVKQPVQILTIANYCNECGNCTTFCPTNGAPYKVKPRIYLDSASFGNARNGYHLCRHDDGYRLIGKENGKVYSLADEQGTFTFHSSGAIARLSKETFRMTRVDFLNETCREFTLYRAAVMRVIMEGAISLTP